MKALSLVLPVLCISAFVACGSGNSGTGAGLGGRGGAEGEGAFAGSAQQGGGEAGAISSGKGKGGAASGKGGAGAGGSAGTAAGEGGGGGAVEGGSALCDAYVACVAAANPAALGPIAGAYGKQGNCFDQGDLALCEKACKTGLVQTHGSFPKVPECNYCDSSKDCGKDAPACDTKEHVCKACATNTHCQDEALPACDVPTFTCVACNGSVGCDGASTRPVCDLATSTCVACATNDDCASQAANGRGICGTSGKCRGCATDGECNGGKCDTSQQRCVGCLKDTDCAGGGSCDSFTNTCCGEGLCEQKGFVCGTTSASGCGGLFGTPVACGTCGDGTHCSDHQCVAPPAEGCAAACDSKQRCGYDASSNTRLCVPRAVGCEDNHVTGCGPGYSCESKESQVPPFKRYYFCVGECLVDGDCPSFGGQPPKCNISPGEVGQCAY